MTNPRQHFYKIFWATVFFSYKISHRNYTTTIFLYLIHLFWDVVSLCQPSCRGTPDLSEFWNYREATAKTAKSCLLTVPNWELGWGDWERGPQHSDDSTKVLDRVPSTAEQTHISAYYNEARHEELLRTQFGSEGTQDSKQRSSKSHNRPSTPSKGLKPALLETA